MIQIEINEGSGIMLVNGQALLLLTNEEYTYLRDLGKTLKVRLEKEVRQNEQK